MTQNDTGGAADAAATFKIHLLDIGSGNSHKFGDCLLCQFGEVSVLIDGGHSNDAEIILPQLRRLLDQDAAVHVSLIIVTHPHDDHIGSLPHLVAQGNLTADFALLADPRNRWGDPGDTDNVFALQPGRMRSVAEALHEHDRTDMPDEDLTLFIDNLGNLETRYRMMIRRLGELGTTVVRLGNAEDAQKMDQLMSNFQSVGLKVIGPTAEHLAECRRLVQQTDDAVFEELEDLFAVDSPVDVANLYRGLATPTDDVPPNRGAINLQSIVTSFQFSGQRVIFGGDMQFADPQVESQFLIDGVAQMRADISADAPYAFVKLCHHGSDNAFSEEIMQEHGDSALYGISLGNAVGHHPHPDILELLDENRERIDWVRSDRNGLVTITFGPHAPVISLTRGVVDDASTNEFDEDFALARASVTSVADMPAVSVDTSGSASEIHAKLPPNATRFTFSVEFAPNSGNSGTTNVAGGGTPAPSSRGNRAGNRMSRRT
ncbi:MAG TPA: MBL fold metallo-hydrolase [Pyrinomonadaceae bacterium]|nr:MBL fold metallo-hydrolase [Pyrinomonadaceae bacterium]